MVSEKEEREKERHLLDTVIPSLIEEDLGKNCKTCGKGYMSPDNEDYDDDNYETSEYCKKCYFNGVSGMIDFLIDKLGKNDKPEETIIKEK